MIVNGFRDGTKADNMVRMKSPSVLLLSREIVLHHFLSLFWSLSQVVCEVFRPCTELTNER